MAQSQARRGGLRRGPQTRPQRRRLRARRGGDRAPARRRRCVLTKMSYTVCIDIGGTFTDCIVAAPDGTRAMFKAPSTPEAFERGFLEALGLAAAHYGDDLRGFLGRVDMIVHGTTVATNALVEGKAGRV